MATETSGATRSGPELGRYDTGGASHRSTIGRVIARGIGILLGLGIAFLGFGFYMLRCFSTCPTDPAENTISQILTLSLLGFGIVVVVAAASLGTRSTIAGSWMVTLLAAMMSLGGAATLILAPSLQVPGNRSSTIILGVLDVVAGAGVVLLARWVRGRTEQER